MAIPPLAQPLVNPPLLQPPIAEVKTPPHCFTILIQKVKKVFIRFYEWFRSLFEAVHVEKITKVALRDHYIYFDESKKGMTEFLNLDYPCNIKIKDKVFTCASSAYEAAGFTEQPDIVDKFKNLNGSAARKLALDNKAQRLSHWHTINLKTMKTVLLSKFLQNPKETQLLLATQNAYLAYVEKDPLWGDVKDGTGNNCLGHMIMEIRGIFGGTGDIKNPPPDYRTKFNPDRPNDS